MIFLAFLLSSSGIPLSAPMQTCEIRTNAWCMIRTGVSFDERTIHGELREWKFYGGMLDLRRIKMTESRSCSSSFSKEPKRSESIAISSASGGKYTKIKWTLNNENSCALTFEIPYINGKKDAVGYDFVMNSMRACDANKCPGLMLSDSTEEKE